MSRLGIGIEDDDFVFVGRIYEKDQPSIELNGLHLATYYKYCGLVRVINCPMFKVVKVLDLVINNQP
jgi:hypothetical protein